MLVPVILSGFLAKKYGKRFELAINSPREAIRALCSQLPGFEQDILSHAAGFRVWADRELLPDADSLDRNTGGCQVRIVPVIAGAKNGLASIIIGAALVFFSDGIASGFAMSGSVAEASLAAGISSMGTALVLGGISQMLFSPPKPTTATAASNQSNLLFSGAVNTTVQGAAVPVCYGRMRIGSQVISAGIESVQMANMGVNIPVRVIL